MTHSMTVMHLAPMVTMPDTLMTVMHFASFFHNDVCVEREDLGVTQFGRAKALRSYLVNSASHGFRMMVVVS